MPALITHHLFGEEASSRIPQNLIGDQEELLAFLLGNQGPDPFFLRFTSLPGHIAASHQLARAMHEKDIVPALASLREGVAHLPQVDKGVGRAFVLGLVGHYVLDSQAHPFIYAQQAAICRAGTGLEGRQHEVHALIESDLDTWMLWNMRHQGVDEVPTASLLTRTERINRVAGALFSQTAFQVFGIRLSPGQYGGAVRDYATVYRAIEPPGSPTSTSVVLLEHAFTHYQMAEAFAHRAETSEECAAANLDLQPWTDAASGKVREDSFPDIFFDSLDIWEKAAEDYVRGGLDRLWERCGRRNYDGLFVER